MRTCDMETSKLESVDRGVLDTVIGGDMRHYVSKAASELLPRMPVWAKDSRPLRLHTCGPHEAPDGGPGCHLL